MSLAYFDTSALMKLFLDEPGSSTTRQAWKATDVPVTGRITYAETRAALAIAARRSEKHFSKQNHMKAKDAFEQIWQRMVQINITNTIVRAAGDLAEDYGLRGYDAVQLACAVHAAADALVCGDAALINAAQQHGLGIIDARH